MTPKPTKKKTRKVVKVKAWAVGLNYPTSIHPHVFFDEEEAKKYFQSRQFKELHEIVPCTISYDIP